MAKVRNVPVFEIDAGPVASRAFGQLKNAKGFSGRAQTRMAASMREAIRKALIRTVNESEFPTRTGRSLSMALSGARAFGTSFASLRGHIIAPGYIKMLEEGTSVEPHESQYLAIPFGDKALRPDGTPKLPGPRSWQNVQKTFVYKSKRTGGKYIAYRSGDQLEVLYVLVEAADVHARHFLRNAWRGEQGRLGLEFGQIMHEEISRIDLLQMARVTYRGHKPKGGTQ